MEWVMENREWKKENGKGKLAEYAKMREEISWLAVFIAQISEIKTEVNLSRKIVGRGEQSIVDYIVWIYQIKREYSIASIIYVISEGITYVKYI